MRIAFVAPYQGPTLEQRRPIAGNLSLGARAKIGTIAALLQRLGHSVEILSQGEVVEGPLRHYRAFQEPPLGRQAVPVHYSSALPLRFVNGFWSSRSTLGLLKARHRLNPFDLVIIYNLKTPQVACAGYARQQLELPVILEYEDDRFLEIATPNGSRATSRMRLQQARRLLTNLSGCLAGSRDLLAQVRVGTPLLLLPGVVSPAIAECEQETPSRNRIVFSGTHSPFQGLEQLIAAWRILRLPEWELHIAGHGALTTSLHNLAHGDDTIVFHGLLDAQANAKLLRSSKLAVVPYEVSKTRGFSFKTVECLAAGLHVVTTRLTALESLDPVLREGLTYLDNNHPTAIASTIRRVVGERLYERTVRAEALRAYGPGAVADALDGFLREVLSFHKERSLGMRTRVL